MFAGDLSQICIGSLLVSEQVCERAHGAWRRRRQMHMQAVQNHAGKQSCCVPGAYLARDLRPAGFGRQPNKSELRRGAGSPPLTRTFQRFVAAA